MKRTRNSDFRRKNWGLPVAREGLIFIIPLLILSLILYLGGNTILLFFSITGLVFVLYFFRDPPRVIPRERGAILSPADGKIVKIVKSNPLKKDDPYSLRVSIFLSIFNVHVNRVPYAGTISRVDYNQGKFLPAFRDKASLLNEQNSLLIVNREITLLVRQIAGVIARRIVCWVKEGDQLESGERFGLIRFGSRVDLFIPAQAELKIEIGDQVKAGETIIGYLKNQGSGDKEEKH